VICCLIGSKVDAYRDFGNETASVGVCCVPFRIEETFTAMQQGYAGHNGGYAR